MSKVDFRNLKDLVREFVDERTCRDHFEAMRWDGKVTCPHCGSEKHYKFKAKGTDRNNRYKCANVKCRKKFNCLSGTVFENTKLPMLDWFKAIYIFTSHKKGISSFQLSRDLGITQKTAWFMLHRLREMMRSKVFVMFSGHVEADETYVGGKEKNKHKSKRTEGTQGRSMKTKEAVLGILERGGSVFIKHVADTKASTIQPIIDGQVKEGTNLYTDEWHGYNKAKGRFTHNIVRHSMGEYVVAAAHTNGIENFWSHLKRGVYGIYHHISGKHLANYCDEFAFRYNTRKIAEDDRFNKALSQANTRLTYKMLVTKK